MYRLLQLPLHLLDNWIMFRKLKNLLLARIQRNIHSATNRNSLHRKTREEGESLSSHPYILGRFPVLADAGLPCSVTLWRRPDNRIDED